MDREQNLDLSSCSQLKWEFGSGFCSFQSETLLLRNAYKSRIETSEQVAISSIFSDELQENTCIKYELAFVIVDWVMMVLIIAWQNLWRDNLDCLNSWFFVVHMLIVGGINVVFCNKKCVIDITMADIIMVK